MPIVIQISSGRRSDNIDVSEVPNGSFESLCPKVPKNHVEVVDTFKILVKPFSEVCLSGIILKPK